ncbi:MAG: NAD(P)/FAD-dependent oxidoreductase [Acidobacteria bacterium]|nr:NAD(P)/FAD-dependent oxidoreductase [Acidobacteriota bacterium]
MTQVYDAIIIGGGAAGLFCAITAGRRGRRVVVIEHNAEVGRKIMISGGGRCNFTNREVSAENFVSRNPHFCRSALAGFSPDDFVELVKDHRIAFYEKKLGQLFCRESSRQIVDMLLAECRDARVRVETSCSVKDISRGENGEFEAVTANGVFRSPKLVIACGGLSFPKIGATGFGYDIARQYGLAIEETRPSLVALVAKKKADARLAGISVDAAVAAGGVTFRENILFTHRGLSGPAILQASNYWDPRKPVVIDLLPDGDIANVLSEAGNARKTAANSLAKFFPERLADELLSPNIAAKRVAELSNADIQTIRTNVHERHILFSSTEGYGRAEVTLGGVSTAELSSKTMESRKVSGLYFIGEVIDVTGWLGGYNFQWAWASGFAAGNAI